MAERLQQGQTPLGVVGFRWGLLWGWWWREVRNPLQGRHWRQRRRVRDMICKNVINSDDFDARDEEERLEGLTLLTSMTFRGDICSIRSHPRISAWVSTRFTLLSIHGEPSIEKCDLSSRPSSSWVLSWPLNPVASIWYPEDSWKYDIGQRKPFLCLIEWINEGNKIKLVTSSYWYLATVVMNYPGVWLIILSGHGIYLRRMALVKS